MSLGLLKFRAWEGTAAFYAKSQYPCVDPSFYFTNAITLGQQVKSNSLPSIRISVMNKQLPIDPPQPPKKASYQQRLQGSLSFQRLRWANLQTGVFDARIECRQEETTTATLCN